MRTIDIVSPDEIEEESTHRSRRPLSISANVDTQPEFAANLGFYRDSKVMTPLMMFFLDKLIDSGDAPDEIAINFQKYVDEVAGELLKD